VASLQQLPHYEVATQFFQAQHQYIGTIFSFVDPSLFRQRLKQIYENHHKLDFSERDTRLVYCQALLVFAYGQMYSVNMWMSNDGPPGFSFFTRALEFLPDIREEGSVLFVEVLALVGYFYQNLNRRDTAFLYIGHALRMAVALGLHQEVSEATMDDTTREHRRRVWWSVYSMDRILCCKSGNPITISDSDISVSSPSPWPGEENPERSSAVVLAHYTELSRILGRIAKKIYRKNRKSRSGLAVCVQTIMADLAQWLTNLPQYLKLDFERIDNTMTREQVSIYLHYHQCINMTARPLLLGVVTERLKGGLDVEKEANWKNGLSSSTVAVIEEAIKAARNSTTILSAAAERELVGMFPSPNYLRRRRSPKLITTQLHTASWTANMHFPLPSFSQWPTAPSPQTSVTPKRLRKPWRFLSGWPTEGVQKYSRTGTISSIICAHQIKEPKQTKPIP
jgi:hypothetical protein